MRPENKEKIGQQSRRIRTLERGWQQSRPHTPGVTSLGAENEGQTATRAGRLMPRPLRPPRPLQQPPSGRLASPPPRPGTLPPPRASPPPSSRPPPPLPPRPRLHRPMQPPSGRVCQRGEAVDGTDSDTPGGERKRTGKGRERHTSGSQSRRRKQGAHLQQQDMSQEGEGRRGRWQRWGEEGASGHRAWQPGGDGSVSVASWQGGCPLVATSGRRWAVWASPCSWVRGPLAMAVVSSGTWVSGSDGRYFSYNLAHRK